MIAPAYDKRNKGYGIHCCEMYMALIGPKGAAVFTFSTGWFLKATTEWRQMWIARREGDDSSWQARGTALSYCSPKPLRVWQIGEGRPGCSWLGCTCYGDASYLISEEVFELLINKGDEAVWKYLENYYFEVFGQHDPIEQAAYNYFVKGK